jgi:integrase
MTEGMKRVKTKHIGVYFRNVARIGGKGFEKCFYITFKKDGVTHEEKVGRQYANRMTEGKAARVRAERIEGRRKSRKELREEAKATDERWTIGRLWTSYIESLEGNSRKSRKAISVDRSRYDRHLKEKFGSKEPHEVMGLDIERLSRGLQKTLANLRGKPQSTKTLSDATQRSVLILLKRIVNYGTRNGLCAGMPVRISPPKVSTTSAEDLNTEELQRLLAAIEADSNVDARAIMRLALFTGMRRGEIFGLRWADIDFDRGFIRLVNPKGGTDQTIPLNAAARAVLESYPRSSEFVFPGVKGKERVSIQAASRRIRDRAGLPKNFRPIHGLRHAFASRLASSGQVDMYTLQTLLTHKSPMMTQRYAHLRDDTLRRASELAGSLVDVAVKAEKVETVAG